MSQSNDTRVLQWKDGILSFSTTDVSNPQGHKTEYAFTRTPDDSTTIAETSPTSNEDTLELKQAEETYEINAPSGSNANESNMSGTLQALNVLPDIFDNTYTEQAT